MISSIGSIIAVIVTGLTAGGLIGAIGIGGVIIVPILVYALNVPIQIAISSAMSSYILTGLVGAYIYTRKGSIRWALAGWICLGVIPGVIVGVWAGNTVDPVYLKIAIGLLALSTALINIMDRWRSESSKRDALPPYVLVVIGIFTGLISALTGTSGPVVLVPILIWLRLPTLMAVGMSQAVQIPVAIIGTVGNFAYGTFDIFLSIVLTITLALGAWKGAELAHIVSPVKLSRVITLVAFAVGLAILLEVYYSSV